MYLALLYAYLSSLYEKWRRNKIHMRNKYSHAIHTISFYTINYMTYYFTTSVHSILIENFLTPILLSSGKDRPLTWRCIASVIRISIALVTAQRIAGILQEKGTNIFFFAKPKGARKKAAPTTKGKRRIIVKDSTTSFHAVDSLNSLS